MGSNLSKLSEILDIKRFDIKEEKHVSREFQQYGYELAEKLGDMAHKSLYIKLAKETPRVFLEKALSFVSDAKNVKNKGSLFMWKLSQLKSKKTPSNRNSKK